MKPESEIKIEGDKMIVEIQSPEHRERLLDEGWICCDWIAYKRINEEESEVERITRILEQPHDFEPGDMLIITRLDEYEQKKYESEGWEICGTAVYKIVEDEDD